MLWKSWESNNLYWTRLADEMGYSPAMLNRMVPELTRRIDQKILRRTRTIGSPCCAPCRRRAGNSQWRQTRVPAGEQEVQLTLRRKKLFMGWNKLGEGATPSPG